MAENEGRDNEDLAEEESPYKVEELKRQGRVAQSREVTAILSMLAAAMTFYFMVNVGGEKFLEYYRDCFSSVHKLPSLADQWKKMVSVFAYFIIPISFAGALFAVVGSISQIGFIFTTEPLSPDFDRINPVTGSQRLFSMKLFTESFRILVKVALVVMIAYAALKSDLFRTPGRFFIEPAQIFVELNRVCSGVFFSIVGTLSVFAGIDYWLTKKEYSKQVRLTKKEQKQEAKEHDGDPMVKARIRTIQRDMARKRMMQAVKKATVIITNPTHIAIAIYYDKDKTSAPRVVAKGADFMAQKIKAIAAEAGIPLVENVPLARTLFKNVKVGKSIPRNLYQAVAEVLAYVYRLKNGL